MNVERRDRVHSTVTESVAARPQRGDRAELC